MNLGTGAFSLMRLLNSLSKTVGIVREVAPIYQDLSPLIKGIPRVFSRLGEIRGNLYTLKSGINSFNVASIPQNDAGSLRFFQ